MLPCDTVAKRPLYCVFCRSFILFKIFASEFGTVGMHRGIFLPLNLVPWVCTEEFFCYEFGTVGMHRGIFLL